MWLVTFVNNLFFKKLLQTDTQKCTGDIETPGNIAESVKDVARSIGKDGFISIDDANVENLVITWDEYNEQDWKI